MKPLQHFPEKHSPLGNVTSEGVLNQLGRPSMDILSLMVREAVQNSWDARLRTKKPVVFGISGWYLSKKQKSFLKKNVIPNRPPDFNSSALNSKDLICLAVFDRETSGLGGPTRADVVTSDKDPRDFVDFLRNVGQPPDKELSGGTYGFGKAAFYLASQLHTILVHTRCRYNGRLESRFTAAALCEPYIKGDKRFTGRHWWGRTIKNIPEPVLNEEADYFSQELGMPGIPKRKRGTTILILQPVFNGRTPNQTMNLIIESLLWYFWPKMLPLDPGQPSMEFKVSWSGEELPIPTPEEYAPLQGFIRAMNNLKNNKSGADPFNMVHKIQCGNPVKELGYLSLQRFPRRMRKYLDTGMIDDEDNNGPSPIKEFSHHVAFMRQPELVVKYVSGPPLPSDHLEYAGVFKTVEEVNDIFAEAEPPTHDDWIEDTLANPNHRTFIRVAHRRIRDFVREFAVPSVPSNSLGELEPLGAFSKEMGALLPAQIGPGAGPLGHKPGPTPKRKKGGGNSKPRASVNLQGAGELVVHDGQPALKLSFKIEHAKGSKGTVIRAEARTLLDGGEIEREPPLGESIPEILGWINESRTDMSTSSVNEITLPRNDNSVWSIYVSLPDAALDIELKASAL